MADLADVHVCGKRSENVLNLFTNDAKKFRLSFCLGLPNNNTHAQITGFLIYPFIISHISFFVLSCNTVTGITVTGITVEAKISSPEQNSLWQ